MDDHYLHTLFCPQRIAVFAGRADDPASQTRQARVLREALRAQRFAGTLQFLDFHGTSGTLAQFAQARADLAILALPPADLPPALELVGRMACSSALVVASGIDAAQAAALNAIARRDGIALLGPNSVGLQRPQLQLNASVVGPLAAAGTLALVSQSGALTSAMLNWARRNAIGFSSVVSLGPHSGVDIAEVLDFLASDTQTKSVIVYLEGIGSARRFMSALRSAATAKPVLVLKAGRRPAGNIAAQTHSREIVGSDEVFDAALRRAGAVRVGTIIELFSAAKCLALRCHPHGRRLAVVSNGGGPGVMAADCINDAGLELGRLSGEAAAALAAQLPAPASLADLIDISEEAAPEHYRAALAAADADPQIDSVLAIHSPKDGVGAEAVAEALAQARRGLHKPLLLCWLGDVSVGAARSTLAAAAIPTFGTPEAAVGAFASITAFYENQLLLQQTPPPLSTLAKPDLEGARLLIESVAAERRQALTEMESKTLLSSFLIPVTQTLLARSANEAMMIATQLGFPVALKIDSPDIAHKSEVQGVALNLATGNAVRDAYSGMIERVARLRPQARLNGVTVQKMAPARHGREINIGVVTDHPFGPVIVFGAGGTMIELFADRAMELPPLNQFLARRLIERARIAGALGPWRGAPAADLDALDRILLRVSEMVCALPQLRQMDINPIIVDAGGAVAVDARIVVDGSASTLAGTPYSHLAILPYPARYEQVWLLPGGGEYLVRPIQPGDGQMMQELVQRLSPESRYLRFVSSLAELPPAMLARFTLIDYDREMALVAVQKERRADADGGIVETERIIGVSRYVTRPDQTSCEFSLVVADDCSGKGLGARLMESIMDVARDRGLTEIVGFVLVSNERMLALMRKLGFAIKRYPEDPELRLVSHPL